jgi:XTP/dITP diphosphohydrolase
MKKNLLIATTNPAKLAEYQLLLRAFDLQLISLRDAGIATEAPEDATTFAENARMKARFYFARAGIATLADDGGLEVDALGGAPGLQSHRWLGIENPDDRELAEAIVQRMAGMEAPRRSARLRAAAAFIYREGEATREVVAESALEGVIADRCYTEIRKGFPYRSVLYLPDRGCYLAELSEEEAAQISQRRSLIEKLAVEFARLSRRQ